MTKNVVMEVRERKYRRNLWGTKPEKQMLITDFQRTEFMVF